MPDEVTLSSTTSSPEQLAYTLSEEWRNGVTFEDWTAKNAADPDPNADPNAEAVEEKASAAEETPKPEKGGWQKRVDNLTAKNVASQARIAELEAALADAKTPAGKENAKVALAEANKPLSGKPKPTSDQFATLDEFADARDAWQAEESRLRAQQQSVSEYNKGVFSDYNKGVAAFTSKHADFAEVVGNADVAIPQAVQVAIIEEGERGAEIAYYLGQNPEVAQELCELSDVNAVKRIGRIAARLFPDDSKPAPKKTSPPPQPPPIRPIVARGVAQPASIVDIAKGSDYAEYKKLRRSGAVN